jgi:hypothetical protein
VPSTWRRRPEPWIFALLLGSYAYYWQSRDWNTASRLMLTYAIVDRGTISLDGLDGQTGDKAFYRRRYYCDKLPGFSLAAAVPYSIAKAARGLPDHPLNRRGFPYWEADYWVTLGTSGLATALTGVILASLARDLGCGPRRATLVALAYGLATPAYAYATLSYGHQLTACALLASFSLLWRHGGSRPTPRMMAAGFLAAYAAVIELSVGPIAAILSFYLLAQVIERSRPIAAIGAFAVGASIPTLLLLGYNQLAFGSPWEMGYFHHATADFARVHNRGNPLGLRFPDASKAFPLLWGGYRGLLFYAPVVLLSVPGWVVLLMRRSWGMAVVSLSAAMAVFLVNLSYPEWTGGWSTGPRLLVPSLPFAMLAVAAALGAGGPFVTAVALPLTLAGGTINVLFQGAGARLPQFVTDPLLEGVLPAWAGRPLPGWWVGERFTRNLVGGAFPGWVASLPTSRQWLQFLPLIVLQGMAIAALMRAVRPAGATPQPEPSSSFRMPGNSAGSRF